MSRDPLAQARELIKNKRYEEARAILSRLDHPTARQWLERINTIVPAPEEKPRVAIPAPSEDFFDYDDEVEVRRPDRFIGGVAPQTVMRVDAPPAAYGKTYFRVSNEQYWALTTIAWLYFLFAVLVAAVGTFVALVYMFDRRSGNIFVGLIILVGVLLTAISIFAMGQVFQLMVEVAINTRRQVILLQDMRDRL